MATINDGGAAFPNSGTEDNWWQDGMTLRDYFAAKAMQTLAHNLLSSESAASRKAGVASIYDDGDPADANKLISEWSYSLADAMLKARDGKAGV